jgi:type I restriction enzyme M protein
MELKGQKFLNELYKKLWDAAVKLYSNIDAAEYKHVVLGLIFLKYVSDAFVERRKQLKANFANPEGSIGNMFSKGFSYEEPL